MALILPGDKTHPPRPNLPVLNHLTFTEIHALELGAYFGVIVIVATQLGATEAIVPLAVIVGRKLVSGKRAAGGGTDCDHDIGFHDAREEPQYFGAAAVGLPVVYYLVLLVNYPTLLAHG